MKKIYVLTLALASMSYMTSGAQNENAPSVKWAKVFSTGASTGVQSSDIITDADNCVYALETTATLSSAPTVYFGDEAVFDGPLTTKNNNDLLLIKADADGNKLWSLHSSISGDYAQNRGKLAITPEGNIIFTAKVRHSDGILNEKMSITDGKGKTISFGQAVEKRYYQGIVGCVSPDGELLWLREIIPATALTQFENKKFISDGIDLNALSTDTEGNIYIGGQQKADVTIAADANQTKEIKAQNINATTQTAGGNMLLIKLDSNGYIIQSITAEEDLASSNIQDLAFEDDRLYVYGHIKGSDMGSTIKINGNTLSATDIDSPIIGSLTSDLTTSWIKALKAEKVDGKSALQNGSISVYNNTLWYCAQYNGKLGDGANSVSSTQGTQREGFIIKLDATNGDWLAATNNRPDYDTSGIAGYMGAYQNPDELSAVYVYGYNMGSGKVFIRGYNSVTLSADKDRSWDLISSAGTISAAQFAYNPVKSTAYVTARSNKAFEVIGSAEAVDAPSGWAVALCSLELPESMTAGINNIVIDNNDSPVEYYNLQGIRIAEPTKGIYIRRQGNKIEKIIR